MGVVEQVLVVLEVDPKMRGLVVREVVVEVLTRVLVVHEVKGELRQVVHRVRSSTPYRPGCHAGA